MITNEQIESFRIKMHEANEAHYAELESKIPGYYGGITVSIGKKNAKYILETSGSKTVVCFVELETGNILKAASWNTPAKGARGHIDTTAPQCAGSHWLYKRF